jgi:NADPH:quinone reductase-like Zn-dependent oxidoreductase
LGAIVTGVCSSTYVDFVHKLGADAVVDYTTTDFTSGRTKYDVIIDVGGNTAISRLRRALGRQGTLVIVGGEGGGNLLGGIHRQLWAMMLSPLIRQKLTPFIANEDGAVLRSLNELLEAGKVRPVLGCSYPLERAADAVHSLDVNYPRGRIVVTP